MELSTIHISQVLSEIRSANDQTAPFLLRIVKSTGRSAGKIRVMAKCLKGFPAKEQVAKAETGQGKFLYKEHDVIPIIDIEDNHALKSVLISHIIGYNQYLVKH